MDTEPTEEEKRRARAAIICTCAKTWIDPMGHSGACNYIAGRVAAALHTYAAERVRAAARQARYEGQERERKIIVDYLRERFAIELADDVEHGEHVLAIKAEAIERDADLESDGGLRYCKPR